MPEVDRIRRMLAATGGRATITISNTRGQHATFRIKHAKPNTRHAGRVFVDTPDESQEYGWRAVGELLPAPVPQPGWVFKPWRGTSPALAYAVQLTADAIASDDPEYLTDVAGRAYTLQAADQCGMCGRRLTHPDSIPVGIGPECAAKAGAFHPGYSSTHVRTGA